MIGNFFLPQNFTLPISTRMPYKSICIRASRRRSRVPFAVMPKSEGCMMTECVEKEEELADVWSCVTVLLEELISLLKKLLAILEVYEQLLERRSPGEVVSPVPPGGREDPPGGGDPRPPSENLPVPAKPTDPQYGFRTNDIVKIRGGLGPSHARELVVNDFTAIGIDRKEYLVLRILAKYRNSTKNGVVTIKNLGYIPVPKILKYVEKELDTAFPGNGRLADKRAFWRYPTDVDVRKVVYSIRKKLKAAGLTRDLIQTGSRGSGYRINTPNRNIMLEESAP